MDMLSPDGITFKSTTTHITSMATVPSLPKWRRVGTSVLSSHLKYFSTTERFLWKRSNSYLASTHHHTYGLRRLASMAQQDTERTVEEQYSRKTPLEHVLLRPGMYVGPNERLPLASEWVVEHQPDAGEAIMDVGKLKIVRKGVGLVPALIKVFDEILVNASDNRLRYPKSCTRVDVKIDPGGPQKEPLIEIYNDGKGIPVQIHKEEGIYVPEMLFGHLLTGSNFDDTEKRITGGRHGYGAKLTNIFSKRFTIETLDAKRKLKYRQSWSDNMTVMEAPSITPAPEGIKDYTCVSFVPDLPRLTGEPSCASICQEDYSIMCRRVLDVAGCAAGKLQVTLNGQDVSFESFQDYCRLYRQNDSLPVAFHKLNPRWTVGVGLSDSGQFESVSFVNGMSTSRGGTHVNAIVQQVAKRLQDKIEKKEKELGSLVSNGLIRRHLFVAVNALVENPTFDSQMKEYLTSSPNNFGSSYLLSNSYLNEICLSEDEGGPGIIEEIIRVARGRQQANLAKQIGSKKTRRQLLAIPKLEDAHQAGSGSGWDCTLILTEGDSAKALAVAGLEVIGRERFGVFPLRGKFLNVRQASVDTLTKNEEVKALCSIIGLDFDKTYDSIAERKELRYGRIMIMTDQDADGSHIKGLIINFFRHFWPKLLMPPVDQSEDEQKENPPFLSSFITPLLKATKKGKGKTEKVPFFSMSEYNRWLEMMGNEAQKWNIKYYKGLGTSTPEEAKEYFSAFDNHFRPFYWQSDRDGELVDLAFEKDRAADRRDWINREYDESSSLYETDDHVRVSYEDFINKELVHFSNADNIRSLPSVIDGLKPSQRKVLYACFKRNLTAEIKVAQLTGYCAEHTAYHHGEASLQSTIIAMAQDFVGSNNINLLVPSGQFGTRLGGGSDAASPRYIFTHLSPIARLLFPELDDQLLTYREDDGQSIEPEYYCPVIPLILVNGTQGIGTGWSTFIPPHHPLDILEYVYKKLEGVSELPEIRPYVRGFTGTFQELEAGYMTSGRASVVDSKSIRIEELPYRVWTNDYKKKLLTMRDNGDITDFVEDHTTTKVSFTVNMSAAKLIRIQKVGLEKAFKLHSNMQLSNMHAFDAEKVIQRFKTPEDVIDAYFPVRYGLYADRQSFLHSRMRYEALLARNKARFIEDVISGNIELTSGKKTRDELAADLEARGFDHAAALGSIRRDNTVSKRQDLLLDDKIATPVIEYDYLLNMPIRNFTAENIVQLQQEAVAKEEDLKKIENTSPSDLWKLDLERLEKYLKNYV